MVTATDFTGKSVWAKQAVPAGAFLSVPGIADTFQLVDRLSAMTPGTKRTVTALELGYFPAIQIISARYVVERKPDVRGHRVYAVAVTRSGATETGEIVVDDRGVSSETLGTTTFTRQ